MAVIPAQIVCDECKRQKGETNHWLVAIERPDYEGIIFMRADAMEERRDNCIHTDLCGEGCAHTKLSRWLGESMQRAKEAA